MLSNNFMLTLVNRCQISKLLPVNSFILLRCQWNHSIQSYNQTTTTNNNEDSNEFLEKLNAAKDNPPSGSTLYQDDNHFCPVLFPDPIFNWESIRTSVNARRMHKRFNIDKIIDLKKQIDGIREQITALKQDRISLQTQYEQNNQDSDEVKVAARALRSEQKSLEVSFKKLDYEFQKESLHLPNIIHSLTPVGEMKLQNPIKSYLKNNHASKKVFWSNLAEDIYNEVIGTYYTGRLAELEYTHMNKVNDYWLSRMNEGQPCNYPVCLSDIVRGPALEATSWPSMKSAIRLKPSKNDMLLVEDSNTGISNWLINPHTADYLVGSASLAAFSAYLMHHRANLFTNSYLRLVSKGSVYINDNENDVTHNSSDDQTIQPSFKSPFHQSKQISLLELTKDWDQCEAGFHLLVEELFRFWQHYQPGWSYKLTYTEASDLYSCEMLRAVLYTDMKTSSDIEISIPLASVSLIGDWISRRIMTKIKKTDKINRNSESYPYMVFMNAWNFRCLLDSFKQIGYMNEYSSTNMD
uniref:28S ribosomal protein S30, mitochondrial n=1 Tax=Schistosoma mansoni TaxID=6183 RepID=A0A3Q0KFI7_SCHMA